MLIGHTVSQLGSEVTVLVLPLNAITLLSAGPAETGLLLACGRAPYLVIGLFAGVIVDRLPHRPILLTANLVMAATLATIPLLLAGLGHLGMIQLYIANTLFGAAAVIADLTYLACVPTVVDRARLIRAQSFWQLSKASVLAAGPFLGRLAAQRVLRADSDPTNSASFLLATMLLPLVPMRAAEHPVVGSTSYSARLRRADSGIWHPILRAVTLATAIFVFCYNAYSAVFCCI
ncbi:MFS transporter [Bradyrhizobium sp. BWA-3-5]|uniref:MFS transporter n=1 Tax=Bradyrhizobium sp. BWA-3-5 TaxID=3080013 RepID=UPI00293E0097|nr:MFS transporter [Bradyrhizobium sp. BWA-3-5]WOH63656.1 MFS transporter [Bradyrhizobium sp. BWA-3-5]